MLPFPIISNRNIIPVEDYLLNIDMNRSTLGTSTIIDMGTFSHTFTKVGTGNNIVVNDTVEGNVMRFDGDVYYETLIDNNLSLSLKHFEMRVKFRSTSSVENILLSTGDYYTQSQLVGGLLLTFFNVSGSQLFCTNNAGTFIRGIFSYTRNTWADISYIWNPITKVLLIRNNDTLVEVTYNIPQGFGNGTKLSIGGSYVRGSTVSTYVGYLKSITIKEII